MPNVTPSILSSSIVIGKNAVITAETQTSNPLGEVYIHLGAVSTLAPGSTPANVVETISNGFVLYGNNNISADPPDNQILSINGLVDFDTQARGPESIKLEGGTRISSRGQKTPNVPLASLDFTNADVIREVLTLQSDGYVQGNLAVKNGVLTGVVKLTPRSVANTVFAENIPETVTVNFAGFSSSNSLNLQIDSNSTTKQVLINGSHNYIGNGSRGVININSDQLSPVLVVSNTGRLSSQGGLSVSGNGSMSLANTVSAANLTLVATNGGAITAGNLSGSSSLTITADGAITQSKGAMFSTPLLNINSLGGSIGSGANQILTTAQQLSANTTGDAFLISTGGSTGGPHVFLNSSSAGSGRTFSLNVTGGKSIDIRGGVASNAGSIGRLLMNTHASILGVTGAGLAADHIELSAPFGAIGTLNPAFLVTIAGGSVQFQALGSVFMAGVKPVVFEKTSSTTGQFSFTSDSAVSLASSASVTARAISLSTPALILADQSRVVGLTQISISSPKGALTIQSSAGDKQAFLTSAGQIIVSPAANQDLNFIASSPLSKFVLNFSAQQTKWITSGNAAINIDEGSNILVEGGNGVITLLSPGSLSISGGGTIQAPVSAGTGGIPGSEMLFSGNQNFESWAYLVASNGPVNAASGAIIKSAGGIAVDSPFPVGNPSAFIPTGVLAVNNNPPFLRPSSAGSTLSITTANFKNSGSIKTIPAPVPPPAPIVPVAPIQVRATTLDLSALIAPLLLSVNASQRLGLIERVPLDGVSQTVEERPVSLVGHVEESSTVSSDALGGALLSGTLSFNRTTTTYLQQRGITAQVLSSSALRLQQGGILFAPANDISVQTSCGVLSIGAGALVYIVESAGAVAVLDLCDQSLGDVELRSGNTNITFAPGRLGVFTKTPEARLSEVNPLSEIAVRDTELLSIGGGRKALLAQFSIPSALNSVKSLKELLNSNATELKKAAKQVLKMAAINQLLSAGHQPFRKTAE